MPLPYRTVLLLPPQTDLVQLLEQEVEAWLVKKGKVASERRVGFTNGAFFAPGVHELGAGRTLSVARGDTADGNSRSILMRLIERSSAGTWQVDAIAVDQSEAGRRRGQLLIESTRIDETDEDWKAAPPGLVSQLLGREAVYDGATPVTARPLLVRADEIELVKRAILDETRSVSVIVAVSEAPRYDEGWRETAGELTARLTGTSAVFVVSAEGAAILNGSLPRSHRLEPGLVRTYLPGVRVDDPSDGARHRFLGPRTLNRGLRRNPRGQLKVSGFLQEAFAAQTRESQLAVALPRSLRRHRQALIEDLGETTFVATVDRLVAAQRHATPDARQEEAAEAAPPSMAAAADSHETPVLERMRRLISKWLRRTPASIDVRDLDEVDEHLERGRLTAEELRRESRQIRGELAQIAENHEHLIEAFDFRGLELVDAEKSLGRLRREVKRLRHELSEAGRAAEAYASQPDEAWATPDSLGELALTLMPDASDHPAVERVIFTGDLGRVAEAERRDLNGLYVQRCWDFVRVLHEYAELCAAGGRPGNVHAFLESGDSSTAVPPGRHARGETEQTMNRWGRERVFKVPTEVDPTGEVTMTSHFKVDQRDSFAPRMHYFDDTTNSGKIFIGYIGRHLTNTKTRNA